MADLKTNLLGFAMNSPIIGASGTVGYGVEYEELADFTKIGGISGKGLTLHGQYGNKGERLWETPSGLINSIGLQNPGVQHFIDVELNEMLELKQKYGIDVDLHSPVGQLSIGMQQKVEILKLLYTGADLLIFDEPTAVLLPQECDGLFEIISNLVSEGKGVIFISHKLDEVFTVCQRIAVIRNGNMIVDKQAKEFERDKLVYYMTGQEIEVTPFQYRKISDKPVLELENCSQHGSFYDISFKLCAGEILGTA